jgi:hypothetical protein
MTPIKRFSISYSPEEDRLVCDTEDVSGDTTRLFLTQRLCRVLIPAILPMLQKAQNGAAPVEHQAAVQSFEQAAALANFGKLPPVKPKTETLVGLITTAHLTPTPTGINLALEFGGGQQRVLGLTFAEVRQMLAVIHRLHITAAWPLDQWPAWITGEAEAAPRAALN